MIFFFEFTCNTFSALTKKYCNELFQTTLFQVPNSLTSMGLLIATGIWQKRQEHSTPAFYYFIISLNESQILGLDIIPNNNLSNEQAYCSPPVFLPSYTTWTQNIDWMSYLFPECLMYIQFMPCTQAVTPCSNFATRSVMDWKS